MRGCLRETRFHDLRKLRSPDDALDGVAALWLRNRQQNTSGQCTANDGYFALAAEPFIKRQGLDATNDALLKLSTGGGETTADAQVSASLSPGGGLASGLLSANQAIAVINAANSMTSQQLSDALYGAGLTDATLANTKVTFADIMANDQHEVAGLSQLANDPTRPMLPDNPIPRE